MRKLFTILTSATLLLTTGCSEKFDDSKVWDSIHSLEERLSAMEIVLKAYENKLFIESVDEITNGYIITFSDGSKATITNGADGKPGEDGDTLIDSIVIGENDVTFNLTDGRSFSIPLHSALSITFDSEDLVVMQANSTRDIRYTIQSLIPDVDIEVVSSADIKAKALPDEEGSLSGSIKLTTGPIIDEYSKVVVFVSNNERVIMKSLSFEEAGIEVIDNATKSCGAEGGEVILEFMSNVECEAVVPEEAQEWISVVPPTRALEYNAITLKVEPNPGYTRSAVVTVRAADGSLSIDYTLEQTGEMGMEIDPEAVPDDEIWYTTMDNSVYDVYQSNEKPFDANIISNTYKNGLGVIKFDAPVTRINESTFFYADNITGLYLPNCIESIGDHALRGMSITEFRVPENLCEIGVLALCHNNNLNRFYGPHVSEDEKCLIIDNILYAFAPGEITDYTIPDGVEIIRCYAFYMNTKLEHITISEGVKVIEGDAFADNINLKTITLPESLESLASYAFHGCINVEGYYGNNKFHTDDNLCLIFYDPMVYSGPAMCGFAGKGLTEFTIPDGITGIENYTFQGKSALQSITVPASVTRVGSAAFYQCDNLEAVYGPNTSEDHRCIVFGNRLHTLVAQKGIPSDYVIPDNITSIEYRAFANCNSIESITMGDQVTDIEGYAFSDCANLKKITLSARLKNISGYNAFLFDYNLEEIYMRAPIPPSYSDTQMNDFPKLKIYVPKESYDLYMSSPNWVLWKEYFEPYEYGDLDEFYPDHYVSTDYSQDGTVELMQTSTTGNGINIVLMGDGYSDRQIADGTYRADMEFAYRNLFTEEPYKSFSNLFDVNYVNVVSATEGYSYGNTALECQFGEGTYVSGNDSKCFEYALNAVSENEMDETLIIVVMNSEAYAGTCFMYYPVNMTTDYGSGVSVAYFPKGGDETVFAQLLHHEACGHGFSKLADEYAYENMGRIPDTEVSSTSTQQNDWGWWKNVDFTSDLSAIRWNYFISDPRYANEGLGAYEGGLTYWSGVWRPTDNSIMRYNTGGFNAPSREAIYYRIHKLAYGDAWQYDYEAFATYDAINRKTEAGAYGGVPYRHGEPLHPPVVVKKSWRDAR